MNGETRKLLQDVNTAIIKIRSSYAAWTRKNQVNYHEMLIFYTLKDAAYCTQKQICDSYLLPKQTVNHVIAGLLKSGYIKLIPQEKDRREKRLVLTPSGEKYAAKFMEPLYAIEKKAVALMGTEPLQRMTDLAIMYGQILDDVFQGGGVL